LEVAERKSGLTWSGRSENSKLCRFSPGRCDR